MPPVDAQVFGLDGKHPVGLAVARGAALDHVFVDGRIAAVKGGGPVDEDLPAVCVQGAVQGLWA